MKKPNIAPYITDAILNPTSTSGLSEEVNNIAPPISTMAQNIEINLAIFKSVFFFKGSIQSTTVAEANEFIDELNVDIAAAKIPATRKPVKPLGKCVKMNQGKSKFGFIGIPSYRTHIIAPRKRNTAN